LQHNTRVVCTSGGHSYHSFSGPHKKLKQEQEQLLIKAFASLNTADRESAAPAAPPQEAPDEGPDGDKGNADSIEKVEDKDSDVVLFPDGFLDDVSIKSLDWVSIVPNHMLPHGDRLIFNHSDEEVMLCWFQGQIYALSNISPASGERFSDAEITEVRLKSVGFSSEICCGNHHVHCCHQRCLASRDGMRPLVCIYACTRSHTSCAMIREKGLRFFDSGSRI
jgi:hypothetical protein